MGNNQAPSFATKHTYKLNISFKIQLHVNDNIIIFANFLPSKTILSFEENYTACKEVSSP